MAQTGKRKRDRPLSISKFGAAKASTYDKRVVKQKQAALNAAKVNKYRKLKARMTEHANPASQPETQAEEVQHVSPAAHPEPEQQTDAGEPPDEGKQRRKSKPVPHIERLALEAQSKKAAQQAARDEALRLGKERKAQRQRAMQRRKQQNAGFRKKTKTGQPVMSVRINKILGQLEVAA